MNRRATLILILIAATTLTFAPTVRNQFVGWDDPETITANSRIMQPGIENVHYYWTHDESGLYVPITYTWWSALARLARVEDANGSTRLDPRVFHTASVVIHLVSVLLTFSILRLLLHAPSPCIQGEGWGEGSLRFEIPDFKEEPSPTPLPEYRERDRNADTAAFFGAMLFAIHPLQVETVAWASGAKDLLGGMFSLLTVEQYIRFVTSRGTKAKIHYALAIGALALGLLSKPIAVVAPLIAGVFAVGILRRSIRATFATLLPMLAMSLACVIWARLVQPAYDATWTPLWTRPLIAADAIAFYICKLFVPIDLGPIYGRTPGVAVDSGVIYYTWILPAIVAVIVWQARRAAPWLACGVLTFFVGILPVSGLARFMFQIHSTVADHYMYLPMLGPAVLAAWLVSRRATRAVYTTCAIVLTLLSITSMLQLRHWHDSVALFRRAIAINPQSATAHSNLGVALASSGRVNDAVPHFERAAEIAPMNRLAHTNLARAYLERGDNARAAYHARMALAIAHRDPPELRGDTAWEEFMLQQATERLHRPATTTSSSSRP